MSKHYGAYLAIVGLAALTLPGCVVRARTVDSSPGPTARVREAPAQPPQLRRIDPIRCTGDETVRLENVHIEAPNDGITADGRCHVILINSRITAGHHGLFMGGLSVVEVQNSEVQGTRSAVRMGKKATLRASNSVFNGDFQRVGDANTFQDRGGNTWNGQITQ